MLPAAGWGRAEREAVAQIHNDQQVYALLGRLFESVVADEEIGPRLHAVDAVVQQQFRRPDATVTMKLVAGEDREVVMGETDLRSEVVLVMDAVTGHRVWLGELSAMAALSKGQIRARGPVAKILRLIELVALVAPRYRAQIDALVAPGGALPPESADDAATQAVEASNGGADTAAEPESAEAAATEGEDERPAEEPKENEPPADEPARPPLRRATCPPRSRQPLHARSAARWAHEVA